jgi:hypothetical protein
MPHGVLTPTLPPRPLAGYSLDDRQRSIRRFVMNAMGAPPWRVRVAREPIADEQRPVAVVEPAAAAGTTRWHTSIPQGDVEKVQTFVLTLYPEMVDEQGDALTAGAARLVVAQWAERLDAAITVGLVNDDGSRLSAPRMLPVYDFAGVPAEGAMRAGAPTPYGWMWVDDAPVQMIPDPDDHLRWTIVCDLRVSWSQAGRLVPPAPIAASMHGVYVNDL